MDDQPEAVQSKNPFDTLEHQLGPIQCRGILAAQRRILLCTIEEIFPGRLIFATKAFQIFKSRTNLKCLGLSMPLN